MKTIRVFISSIILSFFLIACGFIFFNKSAYAQSNNIFGMHLAMYNEEDIEDIARLVNSSGGDWGYITLIIQETDRDTEKWQTIFNKLKQLHLVPLIRLATQAEGSHWRRPEPHEAGEWATFLHSLKWPTAECYVILFNEPNHASEWGGSVSPEQYGSVAKEFAKTLRQKRSAFKVMIAGLDSAAPNQGESYADEITFLDRMFSSFSVADFNTYISGWASHSYPHPNYTGKPTERGRNTITNYDWELQYLRSKGVKDLPVFITETGWKHREPGDDGSYPDKNTVAEYFRIAFQDVWMKDARVQAVTPFTFNYPVSPFHHFSWKIPGEAGFYPQYAVIQQIPKIPVSQESGTKETAYLFRFWSDAKQGHFYTASTEERDQVIRVYSSDVWRYEGVAYYVFQEEKEGSVPVYRFWSDAKQGHFYTASTEERDHVIRTYDDSVWRYEGVGFYVYPLSKTEGTSTVYRFWSDTKQHHFYTASTEERDYVIRTYDDSVWRYEGVAWNVPQ